MNRYLTLLAGLLLASFATANDAQRFIPEYSGLPQGAIILRYQAVAEPVAESMSRIFTKHGWSVLLAPQTNDLLTPQPKDNIGDQIAFMTQQKGQHNLVVLAIGNVWDEATPLKPIESETEPENPVRGVILLDVPGNIRAPKNFPLLDIVTHKPAIIGYEERRRFAQKNQLFSQQGMTLTYSTRAWQQGEDRLTRRIRGWLHHNVKGMALKENVK